MFKCECVWEREREEGTSKKLPREVSSSIEFLKIILPKMQFMFGVLSLGYIHLTNI